MKLQAVCAQLPDGTDINDLDPQGDSDGDAIPIPCPSSTILPMPPGSTPSNGTSINTQDAGTQNLSAGAAAGVAVAGVCSAIFLVLLSLVVWRSRRQRSIPDCGHRNHFSQPADSVPTSPQSGARAGYGLHAELVANSQFDPSRVVHVTYEAPRSDALVPSTDHEWSTTTPLSPTYMPTSRLSQAHLADPGHDHSTPSTATTSAAHYNLPSTHSSDAPVSRLHTEMYQVQKSMQEAHRAGSIIHQSRPSGSRPRTSLDPRAACAGPPEGSLQSSSEHACTLPHDPPPEYDLGGTL